MNREKIIQMARDAGLEEMWDLTPLFTGKLERFAAAIRAATKEEDAKICSDIADHAAQTAYKSNSAEWMGRAAEVSRCISAIRASK